MKDTLVVKKATPLGARVWTSLLVFGFIGQIAWMVENVYFSTYIQKNITAAGWATSATVAASAIAAALATIFSAAWSDRVGKRRAFVCWGYILWGITTAAFALFGNGQVGGSVGLAVTLFVVMDCVMSAIGSTANDSAFSAWVTDVTDVTNRGVVDIVLSILPIVALIVIFAGFDGMTVHGNWTGFFLVLGGLTSAAGVLGLCIFRDSPALRPVQGDTYLRDVLYAFRPANIRANKMIYICFLGMMFSGLAMQLWQPYMISLVEVTLGIDNYILPIGIVVLASAVLSVLAGKAMDRFGKEKFYYPVAAMQVLGGLIAYSIKFLGHAMPLLCVGGTCIMAGNLAMAGLFTASSRDYTPAGRAGASQSVKMVIYIMLPMVLASIIDPLIIRAVALEPTAEVLAKYPSYAGSYLYPYELFLAAAVSAVFILIPAYFVRRDADRIRREKLAALEKYTRKPARRRCLRAGFRLRIYLRKNAMTRSKKSPIAVMTSLTLPVKAATFSLAPASCLSVSCTACTFESRAFVSSFSSERQRFTSWVIWSSVSVTLYSAAISLILARSSASVMSFVSLRMSLSSLTISTES